MESIDALAKAVNEYEGGMVLVSHDMRLISQVAKEIWICDDKTITPYRGDIMNFKMDMRQQMGIDEAGGKLRGDASVKATEKSKKEAKKKAEPKLEVVQPPKASSTPTIPEDLPRAAPVPVSLPPQSPSTATKDSATIADDATAVTTATGNSVSTSTSTISGTSGANSTDAAATAAPKRYIPPHLRKKMADQQQQQQK